MTFEIRFFLNFNQFNLIKFQGEWNGMVRKLIDKQADIGLGSMSVMAERETVSCYLSTQCCNYLIMISIDCLTRFFNEN